MIFKTKKGKYQLSFLRLVRAQGLASPPRRSFAKLTGVLKSAFRLWSNPSSSVLSLMALKTKKLPNGSFSVLVRAQGLALPPRRSFAKLTGVLKSAFRLWSNPSSSVLSFMALKTKKLPTGSFSVLVRAQGFEPWTH